MHETPAAADEPERVLRIDLDGDGTAEEVRLIRESPAGSTALKVRIEADLDGDGRVRKSPQGANV